MPEHSYLKRTWAEISLDRLKHNFEAIRAHTPEGVKIMSVVKADAYGHGAAVVAPELEALGSDAFAVSNIEEAVVLRRNGVHAPILVLGWVPAAWTDVLIRERIETSVSSYEGAKRLSDEAVRLNGIVSVHIKADTGMGRLGLRVTDDADVCRAAEEIRRISELPNLRIAGMFTHFATADEPGDSFSAVQFTRFDRLRRRLDELGIEHGLCHCSNSAATILHREYACDMVRAGVTLYGLSPDNDPASALAKACAVEPVMTLKSTIVQKRRFRCGDTVSYGAHMLTHDADIAVIPVGYADGYPRLLSGTGMVGVQGTRAKIVGKVCMDMTMIDVSGSSAAEGSEVLLFGKTGDDWIPAESVAALAGTIGYELVCCIGRRVTRVYLKDGKEVTAVRLTTA